MLLCNDENDNRFINNTDSGHKVMAKTKCLKSILVAFKLYLFSFLNHNYDLCLTKSFVDICYWFLWQLFKQNKFYKLHVIVN